MTNTQGVRRTFIDWLVQRVDSSLFEVESTGVVRRTAQDGLIKFFVSLRLRGRNFAMRLKFTVLYGESGHP